MGRKKNRKQQGNKKKEKTKMTIEKRGERKMK